MEPDMTRPDRMMKRSITRSEMACLLYISQGGPMTAYALGKELEYSEKTAYASTKSLVKKNLLTREVIDQTRAGRDKINYNLTFLGLTKVFIYTAGEPDLRNYGVTRWAHLAPLVLGKWDVLRTVNEKYAAIRLVWASMSFFPDLGRIPPVNTFYHHFYGVLEGYIEGSTEDIHFDWLRDLTRKDSDIRDFVMSALEQGQTRTREWLRLLKEIQ